MKNGGHRQREEQLEIIRKAGVDVVETRKGKGSHVIVVAHYRGFFRKFIVTTSRLNWRSMLNFEAEVRRFQRKVEALLRGEEVDLALGTPGAIFRRREDL